jgi:hypothetical protein
MAHQFFAIRCPNKVTHIYEENGKKRRKRKVKLCGAILKLFAGPKATFTEIYLCARCAAHWRVVRDENGATNCMLIPHTIKLPVKDQPMRVTGMRERKVVHKCRK